MIVEEHGMGFWTLVRLPSSPLRNREYYALCFLSRKVLQTSLYDKKRDPKDLLYYCKFQIWFIIYTTGAEFVDYWRYGRYNLRRQKFLRRRKKIKKNKIYKTFLFDIGTNMCKR